MDQSVAEVDAYTAPESSEAVQQASLDALLGLMRHGAPAPLELVRAYSCTKPVKVIVTVCFTEV